MFSFLVSRNAETYGNITAEVCWQRLLIYRVAAAYKRHEAQGSTCACRLGLLNGAPIVER